MKKICEVSIVVLSCLLFAYVVLMLTVQYPTKAHFNPIGFQEVPKGCFKTEVSTLIYCNDYSAQSPKWLVWSLAEYRHNKELNK